MLNSVKLLDIPWCNSGECAATCTKSSSVPSPYPQVSVLLLLYFRCVMRTFTEQNIQSHNPYQAFPRFSRRCRQRALVMSCWRSSSSTAATTCRRPCTVLSSAAASTSPARRPSSSSGCNTRKVSAGCGSKPKARLPLNSSEQHRPFALSDIYLNKKTLSVENLPLSQNKKHGWKLNSSVSLQDPGSCVLVMRRFKSLFIYSSWPQNCRLAPMVCNEYYLANKNI